jgi:phosphoenolpyruvate carboxykinase (GTP)
LKILKDIAIKTAIGFVPKIESLDLTGLDVSASEMNELMSVDLEFFKSEALEIRKYFDENVNASMPKEIYNELDKLEKRLGETTIDRDFGNGK